MSHVRNGLTVLALVALAACGKQKGNSIDMSKIDGVWKTTVINGRPVGTKLAENATLEATYYKIQSKTISQLSSTERAFICAQPMQINGTVMTTGAATRPGCGDLANLKMTVTKLDDKELQLVAETGRYKINVTYERVTEGAAMATLTPGSAPVLPPGAAGPALPPGAPKLMFPVPDEDFSPRPAPKSTSPAPKSGTPPLPVPDELLPPAEPKKRGSSEL